MQIQIRITGTEAAEEACSLYEWLREDHEIRRHARISLMAADPGPSEMGTAFEVVQLAADSGFQALNLALAYATWRASRPHRPQVTIERDDTRITLDDADTNTVDAIVRALR